MVEAGRKMRADDPAHPQRVRRGPYYRSDPPIPPYAQEKVGENGLEDGRRVRLAWPTIAAWKAYVRALTSHLQGQDQLLGSDERAQSAR